MNNYETKLERYIVNGNKEWRLIGKLHREDGPAYEWADGTKEWWLNGQFISNNSYFLNLKGNYILVERGIPTDKTFGKLKLTIAKLLTAEGTMFIYDNLPGNDKIVEGNG